MLSGGKCVLGIQQPRRAASAARSVPGISWTQEEQEWLNQCPQGRRGRGGRGNGSSTCIGPRGHPKGTGFTLSTMASLGGLLSQTDRLVLKEPYN